MNNENTEFKEGIAAEIQEKIEEPPMYKVLLHNDDYTTKEFVVGVLMTFFDKSIEEATRLMWHIHKNGIGVLSIGEHHPFGMESIRSRKLVNAGNLYTNG